MVWKRGDAYDGLARGLNERGRRCPSFCPAELDQAVDKPQGSANNHTQRPGDENTEKWALVGLGVEDNWSEESSDETDSTQDGGACDC